MHLNLNWTKIIWNLLTITIKQDFFYSLKNDYNSLEYTMDINKVKFLKACNLNDIFSSIKYKLLIYFY